ncbi:TPA: NAD-dependent epimerase/dehydratase family protein, partial [Enterococcus faecium]
MDIKKNALLLGGTGAMGRYLQDELVAMGFNVVVTTRSTKKSENSNIHYLTGNAKDLVFLKEILSKNWDVIFDFMVYETSDFIERVLILLESCKQYFFISSYRVFNDSEVP